MASEADRVAIEQAALELRTINLAMQAIAATLTGVAQTKVQNASGNIAQARDQLLKAAAKMRVDDLTTEVTAVQAALTQATTDYNALP